MKSYYVRSYRLLRFTAVHVHLHSESFRKLCHTMSDSTISDYSQTHSVQAYERSVDKREILRSHPCSVVYGCGIVTHVIGDLKDQRHGMLSHRFSSIGRNVAHRNSMCLGRCHVGVIESCRQFPNKFKVWT